MIRKKSRRKGPLQKMNLSKGGSGFSLEMKKDINTPTIVIDEVIHKGFTQTLLSEGKKNMPQQELTEMPARPPSPYTLLPKNPLSDLVAFKLHYFCYMVQLIMLNS